MALSPGKVRLSRIDRLIARLMLLGKTAKYSAGVLEISPGTVNRHIAAMCKRAGVRDRFELLLWFQENPQIIVPGGEAEVGLHSEECQCSVFCRDLGKNRLKLA